MSEVVTANKLHSGAVVYLDREGGWVEAIDRAAIAADANARAHLDALAANAVAHNEVTSVYAFAVRVIDGCAEPLSVREKIRAAHAPTV
ncbi:MAG TPA: DUF2849 domain-containing protein [Hyphomicrobiaceae bacterium]|nr:DUF2849 domain-containing protein [Hyphomicrobiaceae bacterium]